MSAPATPSSAAARETTSLGVAYLATNLVPGEGPRLTSSSWSWAGRKCRPRRRNSCPPAWAPRRWRPTATTGAAGLRLGETEEQIGDFVVHDDLLLQLAGLFLPGQERRRDDFQRQFEHEAVMGGHRRQRRGLDPGTQGFPGEGDAALLERALDDFGRQRHLGIHQVQLHEFLAHGFRPAFGQRGEADQQWIRIARGLGAEGRGVGPPDCGAGGRAVAAQLAQRARSGTHRGRVAARCRSRRRRRGRKGDPAAGGRRDRRGRGRRDLARGGEPGLDSGLGRANRKDQALAALVERAGDLRRDFDLLLHAPARDQGGVEPGQNLSQRQRHQYADHDRLPG